MSKGPTVLVSIGLALIIVSVGWSIGVHISALAVDNRIVERDCSELKEQMQEWRHQEIMSSSSPNHAEAVRLRNEYERRYFECAGMDVPPPPTPTPAPESVQPEESQLMPLMPEPSCCGVGGIEAITT